MDMMRDDQDNFKKVLVEVKDAIGRHETDWWIGNYLDVLADCRVPLEWECMRDGWDVALGVGEDLDGSACDEYNLIEILIN